MTTGAELRAARRAADLTLADVAQAGGISSGHLSRVESGERPVTPALVELYRRAAAAALAGPDSPTVDPMRRRDLLAAGLVTAVPATVTIGPADADEAARWLAWHVWRSAGDGVPASAVPHELVAGMGQLVQRRIVVPRAGLLRFPHAGLLDFYLAGYIFAGLESGASDRLRQAQTTHGTDLVLADFAGISGAAVTALGRWTAEGEAAVLRVNAAGVLAKLATPETTDRVVTALRADEEMRQLYLTAVASRVLALPWDDACRIACGEVAGRVNLYALTEELRNPRDGAARWCSAILLHHVGAASHEHTRAAIAASLRSEPASENLRAMAALLAGTDPLHP
jgi:transcriptional regulator with XRE-family HTH domain